MRFPVRGGVGCAVVIAFAALVAAPNASSKPVARQFASSAQNVDLGVTIARRPDRVLIYTQVTYQVTLTNHGPDTAYEGAGISIDTTLDSPGARVESIVADRDGTCTGTSCLWSGPIASGDTRTATVVVSVGSEPGPAVHIAATTDPAGSYVDGNSGNDSASDSLSTVPTLDVDLAVSMTRDPGPILAGTTATYHFTLTNHGPDDAPAPLGAGIGITTTNFAPDAHVVSLTADDGSDACVRRDDGTGGNCLWRSLLPAGASRSATLVFQTSPWAGANAVVSAIALTYALYNDDITNNIPPEDSLSTVPTVDVDLAVTANTTPDRLDPLGDGTYTATLTNNGPDAAVLGAGVNVDFTSLAPDVQILAVEPTGGGTCTETAPRRYLCSWDALKSGAERSVVAHIVGGTNGGHAGQIIATTVSRDGYVDPEPGNNSGEAGVYVKPTIRDDFSVTVTHTPDPILSGGSATFTFVITNNGPDAAPVGAGLRLFASFFVGDGSVTAVSSDDPTQPCDGASGSCDWRGAWPAGVQHAVTVTIDAGQTAGPVGSLVAIPVLNFFLDNDPEPSNDRAEAPIVVAQGDTAPPDVTCDPQPATWQNKDVVVHCAAADQGSGLADPTAAAFDLTTAVSDGSADADASTGSRPVCDRVGNCAQVGPFRGLKVDRSRPVVSCGSSDGAWHSDNVSIACTSSDTGSGLVNTAGANFTLTTAVPVGTETSNASTASRSICDVAGNCAPAGPVPGNRVDRKAPTITISTPPPAATFLLGQSVVSAFSCADGGSGSDTCVGPVANGANIDTGSVELKSFGVTATDRVGNAITTSVAYRVIYAAAGICNGAPGHAILQPINTDGSSVFKQGSTVPAKFRVCDSNGNSIGSPGVVSGFRLVQTIAAARADVNESVDSTTPDSSFRWDAGARQWIFNMSTKNLAATATYVYRITLADGSNIEFRFGLK